MKGKIFINPNEITEEKLDFLYTGKTIPTLEEYFQIKTNNDIKENAKMYELPEFNKRLIVVDTEVTGKGEKDFIIELSAFEIINGKITGNIFHSFFNPKNKGYNFISKHKIPTEALQHTYKEDKNQYFNFLKFIEYDSIIICHNAIHDRKMINRSLHYYGLPPIFNHRFRCSIRMFLNLYRKKLLKFSSLENCLKYLNIKYNKTKFHLAVFDAFYASKIIEKIYLDEELYNTVHNLLNSEEREEFDICESFLGSTFNEDTNDKNNDENEKHLGEKRK